MFWGDRRDVYLIFLNLIEIHRLLTVYAHTLRRSIYCKKLNFYKSELLCTQDYINNNKTSNTPSNVLFLSTGGPQNKIITVIGSTTDYISVTAESGC